MATWIKSDEAPDTYWQIANITRVTTGELFDAETNESRGWWIQAVFTGGGLIPLKGPYADAAAARTALTNGIAGLGGAI